MNNKGFSKEEFIIVIAIIGILAAALFPSMNSYLKRANALHEISEKERCEYLEYYQHWLSKENDKGLYFDIKNNQCLDVTGNNIKTNGYINEIYKAKQAIETPIKETDLQIRIKNGEVEHIQYPGSPNI